jgi:class 3 adenylate cyclase
LILMNSQIDVREVLPSIQAPTIVLHRLGDGDSKAAEGRYIAARIPDARFVELAGDDHAPWIDSDQILDEVEEFLTGSRRAREVDRVLATVLFTDVVGSTEKAAVIGDAAWRELRTAHDEIVRAGLDRYRGREIDTAGDGFLATFDGPARAVRCACAVRDGVRAIGLEVRVGLHTGEIELVGARVSGIAVHIGARVAAAAEPGQVVASSTVKDLVAGSGIEFDDLGTRELKGVPDEWRLFAVTSV